MRKVLDTLLRAAQDEIRMHEDTEAKAAAAVRGSPKRPSPLRPTCVLKQCLSCLRGRGGNETPRALSISPGETFPCVVISSGAAASSAG